MADQKVTDLTADTTPTEDDLFYVVNDPSGTPGDRKVSGLNAFKALGPVAQVVNTQTGAVATGTTVIPFDDTIPQNTEGDEYMTLSITPKATTNKLKIDVVVMISNSLADNISVALFQDSTANALAALSTFIDTATAVRHVSFTHYMAAGTTSSTTFKVRAGRSTTGTVTFNGQLGGRLFGGTAASSITITEIRA